MTCIHLRQLYELCQEHELSFSSGNLVHIVCNKCQRDEVCPSVFIGEYESRHPERTSDESANDDTDGPAS